MNDAFDITSPFYAAQDEEDENPYRHLTGGNNDDDDDDDDGMIEDEEGEGEEEDDEDDEDEDDEDDGSGSGHHGHPLAHMLLSTLLGSDSGRMRGLAGSNRGRSGPPGFRGVPDDLFDMDPQSSQMMEGLLPFMMRSGGGQNVIIETGAGGAIEGMFLGGPPGMGISGLHGGVGAIRGPGSRGREHGVGALVARAFSCGFYSSDRFIVNRSRIRDAGKPSPKRNGAAASAAPAPSSSGFSISGNQPTPALEYIRNTRSWGTRASAIERILNDEPHVACPQFAPRHPCLREARELFQSAVRNVTPTVLPDHTDHAVLLKSVDRNNSTAIHYSVHARAHESLQELIILTPNIDINMRDSDGMTPLMIACAQNDVGAVGILLSAGADADFPVDVNLAASASSSARRRPNASSDPATGAGSNNAGALYPIHFALEACFSAFDDRQVPLTADPVTGVQSMDFSVLQHTSLYALLKPAPSPNAARGKAAKRARGAGDTPPSPSDSGSQMISRAHPLNAKRSPLTIALERGKRTVALFLISVGADIVDAVENSALMRQPTMHTPSSSKIADLVVDLLQHVPVQRPLPRAVCRVLIEKSSRPVSVMNKLTPQQVSVADVLDSLDRLRGMCQAGQSSHVATNSALYAVFLMSRLSISSIDTTTEERVIRMVLLSVKNVHTPGPDPSLCFSYTYFLPVLGLFTNMIASKTPDLGRALLSTVLHLAERAWPALDDDDDVSSDVDDDEVVDVEDAAQNIMDSLPAEVVQVIRSHPLLQNAQELVQNNEVFRELLVGAVAAGDPIFLDEIIASGLNQHMIEQQQQQQSQAHSRANIPQPAWAARIPFPGELLRASSLLCHFCRGSLPGTLRSVFTSNKFSNVSRESIMKLFEDPENEHMRMMTNSGDIDSMILSYMVPGMGAGPRSRSRGASSSSRFEFFREALGLGLSSADSFERISRRLGGVLDKRRWRSSEILERVIKKVKATGPPSASRMKQEYDSRVDDKFTARERLLGELLQCALSLSMANELMSGSSTAFSPESSLMSSPISADRSASLGRTWSVSSLSEDDALQVAHRGLIEAVPIYRGGFQASEDHVTAHPAVSALGETQTPLCCFFDWSLGLCKLTASWWSSVEELCDHNPVLEFFSPALLTCLPPAMETFLREHDESLRSISLSPRLVRDEFGGRHAVLQRELRFLLVHPHALADFNARSRWFTLALELIQERECFSAERSGPATQGEQFLRPNRDNETGTLSHAPIRDVERGRESDFLLQVLVFPDIDDDSSRSPHAEQRGSSSPAIARRSNVHPANLRSGLDVQFANDLGSGAGPEREFLRSSFEQLLFKPQPPSTLPLFAPVSQSNSDVMFAANAISQTLGSSPSVSLRRRLRVLGQLLGMTIARHDVQMPSKLSRLFIKVLLGRPVKITDLEALDPHFGKTLLALVDMPASDLAALDLQFTFSDGCPLIKDGAFISVNSDNVHAYVRLFAAAYVRNALYGPSGVSSVFPVADPDCCPGDLPQERNHLWLHLVRGLSTIIPLSLLDVFTPSEVSLFIHGLQEIDVEDWARNTSYEGYPGEEASTVRFFWNVVRKMNALQRARLLDFVHGSPVVPAGGFAMLGGGAGENKFKIVRAGEMNRLPTAHACINQIELPPYDDEETLRKKLEIAIMECVGFSFI
eukprot:ANDGO_01125.mRNA.1 E3 ubiquitin-protein ligase RSP5